MFVTRLYSLLWDGQWEPGWYLKFQIWSFANCYHRMVIQNWILNFEIYIDSQCLKVPILCYNWNVTVSTFVINLERFHYSWSDIAAMSEGLQLRWSSICVWSSYFCQTHLFILCAWCWTQRVARRDITSHYLCSAYSAEHSADNKDAWSRVASV